MHNYFVHQFIIEGFEEARILGGDYLFLLEQLQLGEILDKLLGTRYPSSGLAFCSLKQT